jgi:hypothetical protein
VAFPGETLENWQWMYATDIEPRDAMNHQNDLFDAPVDLSLVLGGPLFQLYRRTRLSGPALEFVVRRLIVIPAIAWLPLLLLPLLLFEIPLNKIVDRILGLFL